MQQAYKKNRNLFVSLAAAGLISSAIVASATPPTVEEVFDVPERPSLNFYGAPGLIDTPSGEAMPDGEFAIGVSDFGGTTRTTLSFQFSPRLSASFRYTSIRNLNLRGFEDFRDRSFDLRYQINRESRLLPAVTVGLQDIAGTGLFSAEYIVATKNFEGNRIPGKFKVSAGLGWGRLGTAGAIGSPFGARPAFEQGSTGGEFSTDQWFRGPVAPFAGVEWQINDKWGLKAEYSSDANVEETQLSNVFTRRSRFNFGTEYQATDRLRIGAYYLYGSELGLNFQFQANPQRPPSPVRATPAEPLALRPRRSSDPAAWSTAWVTEPGAPATLADAMKPQLKSEGLELEALKVTANTAELRTRNNRYANASVAIGRTARVMARTLPASVETFRIVIVENNLPQSTVTIRRSDLEALEFSPQGSDALLAVTGFGAAAPDLPGAVRNEDLYPDFAWSIGPYVQQSFFDPDEPVRLDAGIRATATFRPGAGWEIGGSVRQRLGGNIGDSDRLSDSVLPRVRTDAVLFARGSDTILDNLYVSKQWKPSEDLYARVTAGYLERMFGGVSAELLWKPVSSPLAFGVEANYARQRDFSGLGFQDYSITTGHASAYYEFGNGYHGQLDVGRYLAGDVGATFTLSREFANGWKVGGFFTMTDVSAEDFGEGSFDKGINLTIPVSWFLGNANKRSISTTIRPILRDGGARLKVPGRLYEQVRTGHRNALERSWPGVLQ